MFRWCCVLDVYVINLLWFVTVYVVLLVCGGIKLPARCVYQRSNRIVQNLQRLGERSRKFTDDINVD